MSCVHGECCSESNRHRYSVLHNTSPISVSPYSPVILRKASRNARSFRCSLRSGRRRFLQRVISRAVVGVAAQAGINFVSPQDLRAQTNLNPDGALQELLAGKRRFAADQLTSIEPDLAILKAHTVDKQEPFAAILACADSRIPVELVFDQTIGHIFVTRVAGNVVTPQIIASLEYGVAVLGVKVLVVVGHSGCGAVRAAMKPDTVPEQISVLYQHLLPNGTVWR